MDPLRDVSSASGADAGSQANGNGVPFTPQASASPAASAAATLEAESKGLNPLQQTFRERFEALLPAIQRQWPEVARHTLEATRGSYDHVVEVISRQTGLTSQGVTRQLQDLLHTTSTSAHQMADSLRPLEEQLEQLLDDLNTTLRPRIEKPVREKPLMALGIAAGVGVVLGLLLSGRRSA